MNIFHRLFVRDLASGASQEKSGDNFLPNTSSRVWRRRRYIESDEISKSAVRSGTTHRGENTSMPMKPSGIKAKPSDRFLDKTH